MIRVPIALLSLLLTGVVPPALWADTTVELQDRIARRQTAYNERLAEYHRAVEDQERYRAEIRAAELSIGLRKKEFDAALAKLQRTWELFLERPDVVTDHDEKRTYAAAKAAYETALSLLNDTTESLAAADGRVTTVRASLNGYGAELANLNVQLATARFELLQESLAQEKTVIVREELACEELTVRACQDGALERAKRAAVERVSAVLMESETVMEDLRVFSDTGTVAEERQVTKTIDRIRSQVMGALVGYEVLGKGWVGDVSFFYEIEAVVKGQLSKDDYFDSLGIEDVVSALHPHEDSFVPGAVFRDCDDCPEMVVVPAGTFLMGSSASEVGRAQDEGPQHSVTIRDPFAVGIYEVTFDEWDACVREGGCGGYRPRDRGWGRGRRPVIYVNWEDAQRYAEWLARETGHRYRLLSEAEWEYVARAGSTTPFHTGGTISKDQANYGRIRNQTLAVGTFEPNGYGLYDVHGNVWEWVQDCWNGSYQGAPADGSAWERGSCGRRVVRGASWYSYSGALRSANRAWNNTGNGRDHFYGFRVARTLTP